MPDVSFSNLVAVCAVAFAAPLLLGLARRIRLPAVVLEIVAGIAIGPLYRPLVGDRRTAAAALLQATSLPFIVVAARIGVTLDLITGANAAALVAAGLLSVLIFPVVALGLLRERTPAAAEGADAERM